MRGQLCRMIPNRWRKHLPPSRPGRDLLDPAAGFSDRYSRPFGSPLFWLYDLRSKPPLKSISQFLRRSLSRRECSLRRWLKPVVLRAGPHLGGDVTLCLSLDVAARHRLSVRRRVAFHRKHQRPVTGRTARRGLARHSSPAARTKGHHDCLRHRVAVCPQRRRGRT